MTTRGVAEWRHCPGAMRLVALMASPTAESLPGDIEAPKAMLPAERQAHRAEARNQALPIEKLEQQIARLRHERS